VGIGVATGADDVFIVDQQFEVERELLMPLVTTSDIVSGSVQWGGQCVINPFAGNSTELVDLKKFPKARAHFQRHRERLLGRNVAKRDRERWYRTIDRIYPSLQRQHKLLIPDIKAENLVVLESGQLYPHHNLYYVASEVWDLRALRTILRSSVGEFFVSMYGVKMRSDYLRFQAQYLRRICVPMRLAVKQHVLSRLIAADASEDQDELDAVAAALYELSESEMKLVKGVAAPRVR
jgi:adenine-specific DNA-methyltransferase